ncbi:MAG: glycosyltransferase family 2 protein [Armatimonadota bacterium]|nr:glycosyltransferase family 2 protein [Armatimonadota bacterium]
MPSISAVLPAYNEEGNLARTVGELVPVLARTCEAYEVVVVNDGSTDRTAAVAERLAAQMPAVRVVHHARNLGYGSALRTGFGAATLEWILLLDADGQFDPRDLDDFVTAAGAADLVLGYRERRADAAHRGWFAVAWRYLMRILLGVRARDIDCAFKLMRASLIRSLGLESGGAFISAELLAKAGRRGARVVEVPVSHRPRLHGTQTGGNPRVLVRAFYELGRLWWRVRRF